MVGSTAAELSRQEYDFRRLEDVVPGSTIRVALGVVYIDYENIHIGLERMGIAPDPAAIVDAIRSEVGDLGKIVEVHAYADWQELARGKQDIQRELVKLGVKTHYQISKHGKNTADMDIVNDVRTRIERPAGASDAVDVVVLVTRDRDFATIAKQAQSQGKRVRIVGLRDGFSQDLAQAVGDVRYLDSHFARPAVRSDGDGFPRRRADDAQFRFIMRTVALMQQKKYPWVYTEQAGGECGGRVRRHRGCAAPGAAGTGERAAQGGAGGSAAHGEPPAGAPGHLPGVVALRADRLLPEQAPHALRGHELPEARDGGDARLQALGVGQTWPQAKKVLEMAAASGVIEKRSQPHPQTPGRQIDTWWLAGTAPAEGAPTAEPAGTQPAAQEPAGPLAEEPQAAAATKEQPQPAAHRPLPTAW